MVHASPFLNPEPRTTPGVLAIALLSRDNYQPITLEQSSGAVDGYAEGATLNTRFGSFPHSTLLDIPWGSQVRASAVDTGSRGRRKRKLEQTDEDTPTASNNDEESEAISRGTPAKQAVAASSGFIHILRPTPELWTSSLPHRTQVVYTPDYSYILHRIRARPGTRIIEAGAGSGSFSHASARAVYNGYPKGPSDRKGKVFSFEFHKPRYEKMQEELQNHGLEGIVELTHRDVYGEGFLLNGESPKATAVFLDLPAPWEALHHLSRRKPKKAIADENGDSAWVSPLDPEQSVHICTFSPCIEQVTRTVEELRSLGWIDVDMVEISHRRINIQRDRIGISVPNERGANQSPADVAEALVRLKDINKRAAEYQRLQFQVNGQNDTEMDVDAPEPRPDKNQSEEAASTEDDDKPWAQGRLCHRTEGDIRTHTSYLVFAVLPREWDEDAEAAVFAKWPCGKESKTIGSLDKIARKQERRDFLQGKKKQKQENKEKKRAENPGPSDPPQTAGTNTE
ncbi:hypothetical protein S40293_04263 [Stachybotrys chartarum IBT 40293]|nr:hypothetical protein S40293_04263 [Stachybotrys chartarum IBT 40293]KFA77774.1 hypothetical protein S40288_00510 [Stachybotrys chartarum IBT 40288]